MVRFSTKFLIISSIIFALGLITSAHVFAAYNIEKAKQLNYPIVELGSCKSFEECKAYCFKDENIPTCMRFDIDHGLLTKAEVADTEQLLSLMDKSGMPGKCQNMAECLSYCESVAHTDECLGYATRHNLIPPGWSIDQVRKLAQLQKEGVKFPGNCQGYSECEAYCEDGAHIDECLAFAGKADILSSKDLAEAEQVAPFIKSGQMPGGCKSKAACETYCADASHNEECVTFAEKAGFMTKEDADILRKTNGERPGNCKSKEECQQFCSDAANQQTCIDFAKKAGLLSPEESGYLDRFKDFSICFDITSPEVRSCLVDNLGQDNIDLMKKGIIPMDLSLIEKFKAANQCVAKSPEQDIKDLPEEMKTCLSGKLGSDFLDKVGSMNVSCKDIGPLKKAIDECTAEGKTGVSQAIDQCLTVSCADLTSCFDKLSEKAKKGGYSKDQDPRVQARVQECKNEQINTCLSKPCGEFLSCLNDLQKGEQQTGEKKPGNPAINAKIQECTKKQQPSGQQGGGGQPINQQPSSEQQQPQQSQQPQVDCSVFASAPKCSDVGAEGSQSYNLCRQCFPDR